MPGDHQDRAVGLEEEVGRVVQVPLAAGGAARREAAPGAVAGEERVDRADHRLHRVVGEDPADQEVVEVGEPGGAVGEEEEVLRLVYQGLGAVVAVAVVALLAAASEPGAGVTGLEIAAGGVGIDVLVAGGGREGEAEEGEGGEEGRASSMFRVHTKRLHSHSPSLEMGAPRWIRIPLL